MIRMIVPHIYECWPEDGLIRPKHVATKTLIFIHCCCVVTVTFPYLPIRPSAFCLSVHMEHLAFPRRFS